MQENYGENVFQTTVDKFSHQDCTSDNRMRLFKFVTVSVKRFQHKDILKITSGFPDQRTNYHIEHLVVDIKHSSSVMDVSRGANIDSEHYLVAEKDCTRIIRAIILRNRVQLKLFIKRLHL